MIHPGGGGETDIAQTLNMHINWAVAASTCNEDREVWVKTDYLNARFAHAWIEQTQQATARDQVWTAACNWNPIMSSTSTGIYSYSTTGNNLSN